jgi:hypothetical protein
MSKSRETNLLTAFEAELARRERHERELEELWRMTAAERRATLLAGRITRRQLAAWRERRPAEIPLPETIRRAQEEALWHMTTAERVSAMEAGRLTQHQLFAWSQRRPYEVPLIDGELAWIVYRTADWIEAARRRQSPEPNAPLVCGSTGQSLLDCDCGDCASKQERALTRMRADGVV